MTASQGRRGPYTQRAIQRVPVVRLASLAPGTVFYVPALTMRRRGSECARVQGPGPHGGVYVQLRSRIKERRHGHEWGLPSEWSGSIQVEPVAPAMALIN